MKKSTNIQDHWIDSHKEQSVVGDCHVDVFEKEKVSLVILARNEAESIGSVISSGTEFAGEIVVVDGHSTDGTREIAENLGAKIVLDNREGKGDAIRIAADVVENEVVVFIDADGSHFPGEIPSLCRDILKGDADLVIGSRGRGGSDELHGDIEKLIRMIGSDLILIGINMRFGVFLTDSQNGFRAIRTSVLKKLPLREKITTIEQEMTMKALKLGYSVSEVPSHEYARYHGSSTIKLSKVWWRYIYSFLRNLF